MIPSTSYEFLVRDLVSGREYDLCVLAVYDDGVTSLTTTRQPQSPCFPSRLPAVFQEGYNSNLPYAPKQLSNM
ncbi:hypothetical protein cypCar_00040219 [Cyprinus carpio]|nr:hypothetical protein cypCar_00040219 [Cyprinus carpio]